MKRIEPLQSTFLKGSITGRHDELFIGTCARSVTLAGQPGSIGRRIPDGLEEALDLVMTETGQYD